MNIVLTLCMPLSDGFPDFMCVSTCSATSACWTGKKDKTNFKENRNNLQIILHTCRLLFYHFAAVKENNRCILRRCTFRSIRARDHLCPQLAQEMLQNLMFYTLKSSHGTCSPLFGTQAARTVPYTRGNCLQIRCKLQTKTEQGVAYFNLIGSTVSSHSFCAVACIRFTGFLWHGRRYQRQLGPHVWI